MAHPLAGDIAGNVRRALRWLAWLMASEPATAFVAPWLACIAAGADDSDPGQRERGMLDNLALVARCDGIVLCGGRVTAGMVRELTAAIAAGAWVADLTALGALPPCSADPAALASHRRSA